MTLTTTLMIFLDIFLGYFVNVFEWNKYDKQ